MTATESLYFATADRIRAIYDRFPDGIDPDFDSGLEELEHRLAVLRMTLHRNQ
jgi:hypothetical protein